MESIERELRNELAQLQNELLSERSKAVHLENRALKARVTLLETVIHSFLDSVLQVTGTEPSNSTSTAVKQHTTEVASLAAAVDRLDECDDWTILTRAGERVWPLPGLKS